MSRLWSFFWKIDEKRRFWIRILWKTVCTAYYYDFHWKKWKKVEKIDKKLIKLSKKSIKIEKKSSKIRTKLQENLKKRVKFSEIYKKIMIFGEKCWERLIFHKNGQKWQKKSKKSIKIIEKLNDFYKIW